MLFIISLSDYQEGKPATSLRQPDTVKQINYGTANESMKV